MSVLTSHFSDRVFFPQKSRRAQPKGRWLPSRRSRCCFSVWSRAKYARDFRKRTRTFRWATRDCTCVKSGRQHATTVKLQRGDFFKLLFFFKLFSILQGLYKSCSPRVKKIQRPSMNRIQNVQIMTLFYFFQMYARCEYDATKKGWERGSKGLQNRCVKI